MSNETSAAASLLGRIGAHAKWAVTQDRSAATAAARKAFNARFETQVDPEGSLTPQERTIRAEHARKAYFQKLALKSARARASRGAVVRDGAA